MEKHIQLQPKAAILWKYGNIRKKVETATKLKQLCWGAITIQVSLLRLPILKALPPYIECGTPTCTVIVPLHLLITTDSRVIKRGKKKPYTSPIFKAQWVSCTIISFYAKLVGQVPSLLNWRPELPSLELALSRTSLVLRTISQVLRQGLPILQYNPT